MTSPQKSIAWPTEYEALWTAICEAADRQGEAEQRRVSVSEWLREAARQRLRRKRKA